MKALILALTLTIATASAMLVPAGPAMADCGSDGR
jgi:hypothetical protein